MDCNTQDEAQGMFSGVTHYTKVEVQPGGINIQHVEHLHQADLLKALGIELEVKKLKKAAAPEAVDENFIDQLKPIFMGDAAVASEFVSKVRGLSAVDVVAEVARCVKERKLSELSCHRPLWKLLNEKGYYEPSESNWNIAINKLL